MEDLRQTSVSMYGVLNYYTEKGKFIARFQLQLGNISKLSLFLQVGDDLVVEIFNLSPDKIFIRFPGIQTDDPLRNCVG